MKKTITTKLVDSGSISEQAAEVDLPATVEITIQAARDVAFVVTVTVNHEGVPKVRTDKRRRRLD